MNLFDREPALVTGFFSAALTVAASFLPGLTPERLAALNALVVAFAALVIRSQVTPV